MNRILKGISYITLLFMLFYLVGCQTTKLTVTFVNYDDSILEVREVEAGANIIFDSIPEREGYVFTGWDHSLENINADITIKALYTPEEYEINFVSDGDENIEPVTAGYETVVNLPIPEKQGYDFVGWYYNDELVINDYLFEHLGDIELVAKWVKSVFGEFTDYINTVEEWINGATEYRVTMDSITNISYEVDGTTETISTTTSIQSIIDNANHYYEDIMTMDEELLTHVLLKVIDDQVYLFTFEADSTVTSELLGTYADYEDYLNTVEEVNLDSGFTKEMQYQITDELYEMSTKFSNLSTDEYSDLILQLQASGVTNQQLNNIDVTTTFTFDEDNNVLVATTRFLPFTFTSEGIEMEMDITIKYTFDQYNNVTKNDIMPN